MTLDWAFSGSCELLPGSTIGTLRRCFPGLESGRYVNSLLIVQDEWCEVMTETLRDILVEAIDDEYKARASYRRVVDTFGETRPFGKIVEAEGRHIQALIRLFRKYGIDVPEDDWNSRVQAPSSLLEAYRLAVEAEIENAKMYERLLDSSKDYPDVQHVLKRLQNASRENHLPAFRRCFDRERSRERETNRDTHKQAIRGAG